MKINYEEVNKYNAKYILKNMKDFTKEEQEMIIKRFREQFVKNYWENGNGVRFDEPSLNWNGNDTRVINELESFLLSEVRTAVERERERIKNSDMTGIQSEIKNERERIAKAMEPAFKDFTEAGKMMIKSGVLENAGNEIIENIGFMKSVLV